LVVGLGLVGIHWRSGQPWRQALNIAIIGHAADKFTPFSEARAKAKIIALLGPSDVLISGGCHLGGVDIWAEQLAEKFGNQTIIHRPAKRGWYGGYKDRNLKIARDADVVHVIVAEEYPAEHRGLKFDYCYHCKSKDHIKSGACWTAIQAQKLGKAAHWHIIRGS
jgi:hypothetical protein